MPPEPGAAQEEVPGPLHVQRNQDQPGQDSEEKGEEEERRHVQVHPAEVAEAPEGRVPEEPAGAGQLRPADRPDQPVLLDQARARARLLQVLLPGCLRKDEHPDREFLLLQKQEHAAS